MAAHSIGKVRGLTQLATKGGVFAILALDQRGALKRMMKAAGVSERVTIGEGPAGQSLDQLPDEPTYDYDYLDADQSVTFPVGVAVSAIGA